jgi:hypothetical protein
VTKLDQDIDEKDDQQEVLLSNVLAVLKKHSLAFSEQGVRSILKVINKYQSSLGAPIRPTKSQIRNMIKTVKKNAKDLSTQLKELSGHIALEDPPDSLQLRLNHLVLCCEQSLARSKAEKFGKEGRPFKTVPLRYLVHKLIFTYEKETGEEYIIKKPSPWEGKDRNVYNPLADTYVKGILEFVAPGKDPHEALKTARRPPISLDQARKMFSKNPE